MKSKIFAEFGIGNAAICSTEIERGEQEKRVSKFIVPPKIEGIYLRIWIYKFVIALSTNRLLNWQKKSKVKFKFIFGIEGRR